MEKNTFNISTLSCFIVAGTGNKVAKHGNYGATSISGSSNVMEQLGYKFKNNSDELKREIEEANICFLTCTFVSPCVKSGGTNQEKFRCKNVL
jgi:anthranilate phosphoribosyltransferase